MNGNHSKALSPDEARQKARLNNWVDIVNYRIVDQLKRTSKICPAYVRLVGIGDEDLRYLHSQFGLKGWHTYFNFKTSEFVLCFTAEQLANLYSQAVRKFYCDLPDTENPCGQ